MNPSRGNIPVTNCGKIIDNREKAFAFGCSSAGDICREFYLRIEKDSVMARLS